MPYLSQSPYTPAPYDEMIRLKRFPYKMSEAGYAASIRRMEEASAGMQVSDISYESDGRKVTGIEVLPAFAAGEKGPLIIYNRGGSAEYGALSPAQITFFMVPLAQQLRGGVLASNYRGNSHGEGVDEFGGAEVNDILRLIAIGKEQPWWDGKNIFMIGWSRGGMMAYLAMKAGAEFTAVVVGAAPTDWSQNLEIRTRLEKEFAQQIPGYAENPDAIFAARSAIQWPEKITSPLLMIHGAKDERVPVDDARRLYAALSDLGREVRYEEMAEGDHFMVGAQKTVLAQALDWFTAHRRA
jgi:dipeptidyl aminopeptidase/acylaminoacyl peptidase